MNAPKQIHSSVTSKKIRDVDPLCAINQCTPDCPYQ